jgi:DNA (cytosine-5)-methyltransferase 1
MTHGSLFSGIGGFDLAAEWMGWQNVFHCEWNTFGQRVLKYYWPDAISYNDITKTDFTIHRGQIDILTGGFPCQPYSNAGKRLGKEDDRHLWPEMLRAIREISPRWIVGENVHGIINWSGGLVFEEVQTDLEAQGYEVQSYVLPVAGVQNAPHRRDRVWFVAYSREFRLEQRKASGSLGERQEEICGQRSQSALQSTPKSEIEDATDTGNEGLQRSKVIGGTGSFREDANKFAPRRFPPNWEKFPTVSPICDGNDGISDRLDGITFSKWRSESIKAGGNAVVPQVVLQIFRTIEEYEKMNTQ